MLIPEDDNCVQPPLNMGDSSGLGMGQSEPRESKPKIVGHFFELMTAQGKSAFAQFMHNCTEFSSTICHHLITVFNGEHRRKVGFDLRAIVLKLKVGCRLSLHRNLPERHLYMRSHGSEHFVNFSPLSQLSVAGLAFVASCWMGIASANLILEDTVIVAREIQIATLLEEKITLQAELEHLRQDIGTRTQTLEKRQNFVDKLLTSILPDSDVIILPAHTEIVASPAAGDTPLPIGGPEGKDVKVPEGTKPTIYIPYKADELSQFESNQSDMLLRMAAYVALSKEMLTSAITTAGLNSDDVVSAALEDKMNIGVSLIRDDVLAETVLPESWSIDELMEGSRQLEVLRYTVKNLPLSQPVVGEHYISSSYGGRRDPFKKSWAFHGGIDIAGHWKSPVHVTAPGIVTFVGSKGAYGRMIEIDHQNGFRTRYGHLATILVKKGDTVDLTDKIGLMGNSGRSTGTHLHYEIRYRGKSLNPSKFFKAARYVQTI